MKNIFAFFLFFLFNLFFPKYFLTGLEEISPIKTNYKALAFDNFTCDKAIEVIPFENLDSKDSYLGDFTGSTYNPNLQICTNSYTKYGREVWFKFTAKSNVHVIDIDKNFEFQFFEGDCSNLKFLFCRTGFDHSNYLKDLTIGKTYYIRFLSDIYNTVPTDSTFKFRIETPPTAPSNDLCINAINVNSNTQINGELTGAMSDPNFIPCNANTSLEYGDVWYKFNAEQRDYNITLSARYIDWQNITHYSYSNVQYEFYEESCDLTNKICNKNFTNLTVGKTYYIRIYSDNISDTTNFSFKLTPVLPAENDECSGAINISLIDNDTTFFKHYPKTPAYLSNIPVPECISSKITPKTDYWYSFIANKKDILVFTRFDYLFAVYNGDCNNLNLISCGRSNQLRNLEIGKKYYIRFFDGNYAEFFFNEIKNNDECVNALEVTPAPENPKFIYADISNATDSKIASSCNTNNYSNDIWFKFTATTKKIKINNEWYKSDFSNFNVYLTLYSGACDNLKEIYCKKINNYNYLGTDEIAVTPGNVYYYKLFSEHLTNAKPSVGTSITSFPDPPANDNFINAQEITPSKNEASCTYITQDTSYCTYENNLKYTSNNGSVCTNYEQKEVWYKFTAQVDSYKIKVTGSIINISSGNDIANLKLIGCEAYSNEKIYSGFVVGESYYIRATAGKSTLSFCISENVVRPENDEFENAKIVSVSNTYNCQQNYTGTTINSTFNTNVNNVCNTNNYGDVWYKFIASANSHTLLIKQVSNYKSVNYKLLSNTNGGLICNGTYNSYGGSQVTFNNLEIGKEYYIAFYNDTINQVDFSFCMITIPKAINDECSTAIEIKPSSNLDCSETIKGISGTSTPSLNQSGNNINDFWYTFTATASEHVMFFTQNFISDVFLYEGEDCNFYFPISIESNYEKYYHVFKNLTIGKKYRIRIFDRKNNFEEFAFCLKTPLPKPINDEYDEAIEIPNIQKVADYTGKSFYLNSTTRSTNVYPSNIDNDVWHKFTATTTNPLLYINVLDGATIFYNIVLYEENNSMPSKIISSLSGIDILAGHNNNQSVFLGAKFNNLIIGKNYYIRFSRETLNHYLKDVNYHIFIRNLPSLPKNDLPENAEIISVTNGINCNNKTSGYTTGGDFKYVTGSENNSVYILCPETEWGNAIYKPKNINSDVWYNFKATAKQVKVHIDNHADLFYPTNKYITDIKSPVFVSLYKGSNTNPEYISCAKEANPDVIFENLTVGESYFIKVYYEGYNTLTDFDFDICLSTNTDKIEIKSGKEVEISTNPVQNVITLVSELEIISAEIYTMNGNLVKTQTINDTKTIDVSKLKPGTYVLKANTKNKQISIQFFKK